MEIIFFVNKKAKPRGSVCRDKKRYDRNTCCKSKFHKYLPWKFDIVWPKEKRKNYIWFVFHSIDRIEWINLLCKGETWNWNWFRWLLNWIWKITVTFEWMCVTRNNISSPPIQCPRVCSMHNGKYIIYILHSGEHVETLKLRMYMEIGNEVILGEKK